MSFGLAHYALSEFEVLAEELLMSDSVIKASNKQQPFCDFVIRKLKYLFCVIFFFRFMVLYV